MQTRSYDRFGNRKTAVTRIGETENRQDLQVNGRNNRVNENAGMSYDAAGNVIIDNGKTFKYDAENRMVEAVVNGVTTHYRYDGEGRRIKKTVGTAVTRFVYGMGGELIAEHEGATATPSTPSKEYIYGPTGMLAEVTGTEVNYLTPDHLGSPRVLTSQNGIVVNRRDFFPFGEDIAVGVGGRSAGMGYGTDSLRHKFSGKERDQETGLDFFGARYYGNSLGRFLTTDPFSGSGRVEDPQTWNRYTYVLNCPTGLIDPDGKQERGRGGSNVINVFITFTQEELHPTLNTGKPAPDALPDASWTNLNQGLNPAKFTVNVQFGATVDEITNSSESANLTLIIGHAGGELIEGRHVGNGMKVSDGWVGTRDGMEITTLWREDQIVGGIPTNGCGDIALFGCNTAERIAGRFTDRQVIANDGGNDGVTSTNALAQAGHVFTVVYRATGGNALLALRIAQGAFNQRSGVQNTLTGRASNVGDQLILRNYSGPRVSVNPTTTTQLQTQIQPKPTQ